MQTRNEIISHMLKEYRIEAQLSVQNVAQILQEEYHIPTSEKTIYGWENNRSLPRVDTFVALCDLYGIRNVNSLICPKPLPSTANPDKLHITEREKRFLDAYRSHPELQPTIRKLLSQ